MANARGAGHQARTVKTDRTDPRARRHKPAAALPNRGFHYREWWPVLAIVLVTGMVYANAFQNEFLFDDLQTIVELQQGGGKGAFADVLGLLQGRPSYRPVRTASYAFDYALSGLEPWGYHLTNIVYHALTAVFVYLTARSLFDRVRPALLTALLFAIHPIQTDAVTYMSGRRDVLSGLFVLAGFYLFVRYRTTGRIGYLAAVLPVYVLGFFSKESGIILPALCVAYDVFRHLTREEHPMRLRRAHAHESPDPAPPPQPSPLGGGGDGWGGLLKQWTGQKLAPFSNVWIAIRGAVWEARWLYLPMAAIGGGLAAYVLLLVRGTWQQDYHGGSLWFTLLTMARVFSYYLKLLIFPVNLNADYSYNAFPVTTSWTDPSAWLAMALLVGLWYAILVCARFRPVAAFGGAWFFLTLLPVSQIIPHHEMMAEHYLYVPSVGFAMAAVGLFDPLLDDPRRAKVLYPAGLLVLMLLSVRTVWRNFDWRDELTLWQKTVQTAPDSARARNNLGGAYLRSGQPALAEAHLEAALRIRPDFASARANMGKLYMDRGDLDMAERELNAALTLKQRDAIPRLWLGVVLARKGETAGAEAQFRTTMDTFPYGAYAYNNLGVLFVRTGRLAEAESLFREALRLMPDLTEARDNLARLSRIDGSGIPPVGPGMVGKP